MVSNGYNHLRLWELNRASAGRQTSDASFATLFRRVITLGNSEPNCVAAAAAAAAAHWVVLANGIVFMGA